MVSTGRLKKHSVFVVGMMDGRGRTAARAVLCGEPGGLFVAQTSTSAYLATLAHPSCKQRVLQAHVQASAGDTDVCRQTGRASGWRQTEAGRERSVRWECNDGGGAAEDQGHVIVSSRHRLFLSTTTARCADRECGSTESRAPQKRCTEERGEHGRKRCSPSMLRVFCLTS